MEHSYPGLLLMGKILLEQVVCHLSRNHHISDALVESLACCPVCLRIQIIEEKELQKNCYLVL